MKTYPVVKAMVDNICEVAKREMKDGDLGSWKRAVTTADGTWQTRGWHSKNATFTIRNYLNGALLYYHHFCQKGRDKIVEGDLYLGTCRGICCMYNLPESQGGGDGRCHSLAGR